MGDEALANTLRSLVGDETLERLSKGRSASKQGAGKFNLSKLLEVISHEEESNT